MCRIWLSIYSMEDTCETSCGVQKAGHWAGLYANDGAVFPKNIRIRNERKAYS
jgi:hypothetical protein